MANVILKSDAQKAYERRILNDFRRTRGAEPSKEQREAAETIARRTAEAVSHSKR